MLLFHIVDYALIIIYGVHTLLCYIVVWYWYIYWYLSSLIRLYWNNHMIPLIMQPWTLWENALHEITDNYHSPINIHHSKTIYILYEIYHNISKCCILLQFSLKKKHIDIPFVHALFNIITCHVCFWPDQPGCLLCPVYKCQPTNCLPCDCYQFQVWIRYDCSCREDIILPKQWDLPGQVLTHWQPETWLGISVIM